jgi:uncharacterized protein (DUF1810 family)
MSVLSFDNERTLYSLYVANKGRNGFSLSDREALLTLVTRSFSSFTVTEAFGVYKGRQLPTLVLHIASKDQLALSLLCQAIGRLFAQDYVGLSNGQSYKSVRILPPEGLLRFRTAQDPLFQDILSELLSGHKTSHWMWFVFPQLRGLGNSESSIKFGIADQFEATDYLSDAVLGDRLRNCVQIITYKSNVTRFMFDDLDRIKLTSCLTLFSEVALTPEDRELFQAALDKFSSGKKDELTVNLLSSARQELSRYKA